MHQLASTSYSYVVGTSNTDVRLLSYLQGAYLVFYGTPLFSHTVNQSLRSVVDRETSFVETTSVAKTLPQLLDKCQHVGGASWICPRDSQPVFLHRIIALLGVPGHCIPWLSCGGEHPCTTPEQSDYRMISKTDACASDRSCGCLWQSHA